MVAEGGGLRPLGSLAPPPNGEPWSVDLIDGSSRIDSELKGPILAYLEGCPLFLAWMELTRDLIGDRFVVPGGSGIASDGRFYWRFDAVAYIREYDVAVPAEAIRHFEAQQWRPPIFSRAHYLAIYDQLEQLLVPTF